MREALAIGIEEGLDSSVTFREPSRRPVAIVGTSAALRSVADPTRTFGRPAVMVQRLADKLAPCGTPNAAGRRDQG